MAPDPEEVEVSINALGDAGKTWDDQSAPLQKASDSCSGRIDLTATEMGLAAPIHGPYNDICTGMQQILGEAAKEATDIGQALAHAAKVYEKEEEDGTHRVKGVW